MTALWVCDAARHRVTWKVVLVGIPRYQTSTILCPSWFPRGIEHFYDLKIPKRLRIAYNYATIVFGSFAIGWIRLPSQNEDRARAARSMTVLILRSY